MSVHFPLFLRIHHRRISTMQQPISERLKFYIRTGYIQGFNRIIFDTRNFSHISAEHLTLAVEHSDMYFVQCLLSLRDQKGSRIKGNKDLKNTLAWTKYNSLSQRSIYELFLQQEISKDMNLSPIPNYGIISK